MERKMPFLTSPEVMNAPSTERQELEDAQKTEQIVYEYKVKREEMLSIFDELKEYLSYENIANTYSTLQKDQKDSVEVSEETREKLEEYLEGSSDGKKHEVLFTDFKKILQENPRLINKTLGYSIKEVETKKVGDIYSGGDDRQNQKKIDDEIKARTLGNLVKSRWMLKRFVPLQEDIAGMTEDELGRVSAYGRAYLGTVKDPGQARMALSNIEEMKEGISSAKSSKNIDIVRKEGDLAKIHGVSDKEVKDLNSEIEEDIFELFGEKVSLGIEAKYDELGNIVEHNFMTAYINYLGEMKDLYRMLHQGKIVEAGYVKEIIERAMPALRKNPPTVVYFHGDQGTGKTVLATHISRTRFGKEPIIVAGSKYLDPDRFTEEFKIQKLGSADFLNQMQKQLGLSEISSDAPLDQIITSFVGTKEQIRQSIVENTKREEYERECASNSTKSSEDGFKQYLEKNTGNISPEKMEDIEREIDEVFSNSVQGRYMMGAMFQAMKEGRPLIIDEANAISPDVLIAFNDLMTKKIGEKVSTRTDEKEFVIKDGFCMLWTGNTGERFKQARFQDMDPAAFSRIVPIKYEYLPQSREVSNIDNLLGRLELDKLSDKIFSSEDEIFKFMKESKEQASIDQIFQVMLIKLLNSRLGMELLVREDDKYSVFKDIYRLGVGSRIIMDMFEEKADNLPRFSNLSNIVGSSEPTVLMKKLKKSNLTLRELMDNIIGGYVDEGCSMDIEYYLFKFVKKYDMYPEEQAILYAVLQKAGFFGTGERWPDYQTCANVSEFKGRMDFDPVEEVDKYKKIQKNGEYVSLLNTDGKYKLQYFSSFETLQLLFGYLPARKKEDYRTISKKHKEIRGVEEMDAKKRELIESAREIINSWSKEHFKTSKDVSDFKEEIGRFRTYDEKFLAESSDEEFFAEASGLYDVMLNFLHNIGNIDDEVLEKSKGMSAGEKSELIKSALSQK